MVDIGMIPMRAVVAIVVVMGIRMCVIDAMMLVGVMLLVLRYPINQDIGKCGRDSPAIHTSYVKIGSNIEGCNRLTQQAFADARIQQRTK